MLGADLDLPGRGGERTEEFKLLEECDVGAWGKGIQRRNLALVPISTADVDGVLLAVASPAADCLGQRVVDSDLDGIVDDQKDLLLGKCEAGG